MVAATQIWTTALQQLATLPTTHERTSPSEVVSAGAAVVPTPHILPRSSPAEWNRLVADLKVPLKLGQAAAAGGACPNPLAPRTHAAVLAVSALLIQAQVDGVALLGQSPNSLTRSIGQQLRQSGLLEALPRLLEAAAAALDASAQSPDPADMAQTLCRFISRGHREPHAQQEAVGGEALQVVQAHLAADRLLLLLNNCLITWPHQVDTAAVCVPALRLCVAAFQHCSRCADALPAAAPAPTALEELLASAYTVAYSFCKGHERQQQVDLAPSALCSPDAVRAVCMLMVIATMAPGAGAVTGEAGPHSSFRVATPARNGRPAVHLVGNLWSEASVADSQVAWQAACARESSLSTAQQQVLQELGCSGRAFTWVAGHALARFVPLGQATKAVFITLARLLLHSRKSPFTEQDSPTLNQPQQVRQLAQALSQLQPGDGPPCGSPLLPCAALLWLMPAVLLEWTQRQPEGEAAVQRVHDDVIVMLGPWLDQVLAQQEFWRQAESLFVQASGATGQLPGVQEGPEQQPAAQPEARMLMAASKAACRLRSCWEPPASCLALLLQLSSASAARVLACSQAAAAGPSSSQSTAGARSGSSSSGGGGGRDAATQRVGRGVEAATGTPHCGTSPVDLSRGQTNILMLCRQFLKNLLHKSSSRLLAGPAAAASLASDDAQVPSALQEGAGRAGGGNAASLASLCAALQQTLPQLAAVVEAGLRCQARGSDGDDMFDMMRCSFVLMIWATYPGPFTAARLQPGSPALKALSGVALTVVKTVAAVLAGGGLVGVDQTDAIHNLQATMDAASLALQVACAEAASSGSSAGGSTASSRGCGSSSTTSDAVTAVLLSSKTSSGSWDAASLSELSTVAAASSSTTSLGPGTAAVEMVPWLVTFGRCCMWHASILHAVGQRTPPADVSDIARFRDKAVRDVCRVLPGWLQSDSVSAQLSAAGYNTARLLELLQQAAQAQQQDRTVDTVWQLRDLGLALTSFPFGTGCNHYACSSLGELSEQRLVVGTARLCSGCRVARYCCRACQVGAWKLHKPACKAMTAARAAGNPAAI